MDNRKTSANTQKSAQNTKEQYGENRTGSRSTSKTTGSTNSVGTRSTDCNRNK